MDAFSQRHKTSKIFIMQKRWEGGALGQSGLNPDKCNLVQLPLKAITN